MDSLLLHHISVYLDPYLMHLLPCSFCMHHNYLLRKRCSLQIPWTNIFLSRLDQFGGVTKCGLSLFCCQNFALLPFDCRCWWGCGINTLDVEVHALFFVRVPFSALVEMSSQKLKLEYMQQVTHIDRCYKNEINGVIWKEWVKFSDQSMFLMDASIFSTCTFVSLRIAFFI